MSGFVSIVKSAVGALLPKDDDDYVPIRPVPQKKERFGFGRVIAAGVDPAFGIVLAPVGTNMAVAQSGGNLVLTTGTTINQDTLVRSNWAVLDPYTLRWSTVLSQRIANQQLIVELVDVLGDALPATILNSTQIRVTFPAGKLAQLGWDTRNYGQTVSLGNYSGTGTFVPANAQNAVITTISGNDVTFTTSGLAAGSGTVSVFGWNYQRFTYDGALAATQVQYRGQRNGWPGTAQNMTINTTASPGHIGILQVEDNIASLADMLRASSTGVMESRRGSSVQDMPGNDTELYLQLRMVNGATAPASTTTWTVAFVDIDNYVPLQTSITSVRPQSAHGAGIPVTVQGGGVTNSAAAPSLYNLVTAATTNAVSINTSTSRRLLNVSISNPTATPAFVKFYAKTSAPTVGTDVPVMTIPIAAGEHKTVDFGPAGRPFAGLAIAVTGAVAATDTTNAPAGVQISASYY